MSTPTNHDATKVVMGSVGSSDRVVSDFDSDPASFPAGSAVRRASTGALSLAVGDGALVGVSLGKSLSDHKKTSVVRSGNHVPVILAPYLTKGDLTFISKVDTALAIEFLDTGTAGSEEVTVANGVISVTMDDTAETGSTATQLKAALDAGAGDYIETAIASGQGAVVQDAFAEDDIDTLDHAVIGAGVRVSNVTGRAVPTGIGSLTGAIYVEGAKTGVKLDGTTVNAAVIDMGGGL